MGKLKPCPFCGGECEIRQTSTLGYYPLCLTDNCVCNVVPDIAWREKDKAIQAWNRRHEPNVVHQFEGEALRRHNDTVGFWDDGVRIDSDQLPATAFRFIPGKKYKVIIQEL